MTKRPTQSRVAPVMIVGMHRSGTGMVADGLRQLGLFTGWRTEHNGESPFFIRLNEWLLAQMGGRWDSPPPVSIADQPEVLDLSTEYIRRLLDSPRSIRYLGPARFLRYRSPLRLDSPWGWKDPRTILTLPAWLQIFPKARVIHVVRHGVDVARSLQVREQKRLERNRRQMRKLGWLYPARPKKSGFVGSVRCLSLTGGFALWEEYLQAVAAVVPGLGGNALEVRYEDLLNNPEDFLPALADFCDLGAPETTLAAVGSSFSSDRRFAYLQDEELVKRASGWSDRLAARGYRAD